jgi:DNA-binding NarL/FixJ family response regulator
LSGKDTEAFEVKLETRDGKALWTSCSLEDARGAEILELHADGKSLRDIGRELGMSKSAVQRALAKGKRQ